ncbi:MAG: Na(+)-translocating NADH-quinone reductase subunit A [Bacteroidales bacterium]|nr:Na(+)-translocating NADH-quinone reductase subunit A [Bacteroidales bacterium]
MKIKLNKGLDLRIAGATTDTKPVRTVTPGLAAVMPDDFTGLMPKAAVHEGDEVAVGDALLFDKAHPEIKVVSPVAGHVKAVVRGERRKIMRVIVEADGSDRAKKFDTKAPVLDLLENSGFFAMIRRRPYDTVPVPDVRPRDIFVTAFDTAPLATPLTDRLGDNATRELETAVKALATLTDGKVYISHDPTWALGDITGAVMVEVEGPHPAGNVGIQIANIAPVNKGETVWTLDVVTLVKIGRLLLTGTVDPTVYVAVTGPEVSTPAVLRTVEGAPLSDLLDGMLHKTDKHLRVISGNVLTGTADDPESGFLHFPWRQITVIDEGDDVDEFMGWASVSPDKMSAHRSLPLHWLRRAFSPDARLLGGRRAMIISGEYDKVLPMDVMAEYLLKAINSRNIDDMEALGIYEVAPEDLALCEYVDTSKLPVQQMVRDGLDYLRKELE